MTPEDITELDRRIDMAIPSLPLLSQRRDLALIHLLRYFDSYAFGCAFLPDVGQRETASHYSTEGLHHAVKWVTQFCKPYSGKPNLKLDLATYAEATEALTVAIEYAKVWEIMGLLHRGILKGSEHKNGVIQVAFGSEIDKEIEVAGQLIATPYDPEVYLGEPIVGPEVEALILRSVKILATGEHTLRYDIPDNIFSQLLERVHHMTVTKWELEPAWDLMGYTVDQLHQSSVALDTLCAIHDVICLRLLNPEKAVESIIRFMSHDKWENELARRSGLSREVISAILSDLIYDESLYIPGKKQAHVTFQPFFPFGRSILAASGWLVHISNLERNIWELVSIKRPDLHSRLRNLKETAWIKELQKRCEAYGIKLYPQIKFKFAKTGGDLDLLILDQQARFGLVCQLKWLTLPGRIAQALYNDKEIKRGIEQAQLALEWVNSNPSQLSQCTGLSPEELQQYEFKPLVMCKASLASGLLARSEVPVINERLFDWVLGDPHRKSLSALWKVGRELRYLPQQGKHFEDINGSVEFGGIRFEGEGIGCILKEPWNPAKDINFEGLL